MKNVRMNSVALLLVIPLVAMLSEKLPDSVLDGPFNKDKNGDFYDDRNMVPNTLYYDSNTKYYTVFDDDKEKYVTYDRKTNVALNRVIFDAPELSPESGENKRQIQLVAGRNNVIKSDLDGGVIFEGNMAVPTSHLDEEGMRIQEEFGCAGCHIM